MNSLALTLGWAYAVLWGIAYYPTLYLHYQIKTADSVSFDTLMLNILGYLCYSTSVYLQVYNKRVISEFQMLFNGTRPVLSIADLFYSFHGLFLLMILLSQVILGNEIWGFRNKRLHYRIHKVTKLSFLAFLLFLVYNWKVREKEFQLLYLAINLAYFKVLISIFKYIPQVLYNRRRRSMYGVSKTQVILDLLGSFFSLAEFALKNRLPLLKAVNSNRGKIGITLVTQIFAAIFLVQFHMYPAESPVEEKKKESDIV